MNFRHNPEELPDRDDDGTAYRDAADLAFGLDCRDDRDACAMYAAGDDE